MADRYATRTVVPAGETALIRSGDDGATWVDIAEFTKQADAERAARLFNADEKAAES